MGGKKDIFFPHNRGRKNCYSFPLLPEPIHILPSVEGTKYRKKGERQDIFSLLIMFLLALLIYSEERG